MSQMNPKEFVLNTAYSVQLPYIAGQILPFISKSRILPSPPLCKTPIKPELNTS